MVGRVKEELKFLESVKRFCDPVKIENKRKGCWNWSFGLVWNSRAFGFFKWFISHIIVSLYLIILCRRLRLVTVAY